MNGYWLRFAGLFLLVLVLLAFSNIRYEQNILRKYDLETKDSIVLLNEQSILEEIAHEKIIDEKFNDSFSIVNKLNHKLLTNQYVSQSICYFEPTGNLKISYEQKSLIGRLYSSKLNGYVDVGGGVVPYSKRYSLDLPMVVGNFVEKDLIDVSRILNFINEDQFLKEQLNAVLVSKNKEYYLKLDWNNYVFKLGTIDNLKAKVNKMKAFLALSGEKENIKKGYKKINLAIDGQIIAIKEQGDE